MTSETLPDHTWPKDPALYTLSPARFLVFGTSSLKRSLVETTFLSAFPSAILLEDRSLNIPNTSLKRSLVETNRKAGGNLVGLQHAPQPLTRAIWSCAGPERRDHLSMYSAWQFSSRPFVRAERPLCAKCGKTTPPSHHCHPTVISRTDSRKVKVKHHKNDVTSVRKRLKDLNVTTDSRP
ncbi:hypothetical protein Bbelb_220920 [Branchiostoma belcheri]|nr:hypothetical protein Bbelb_220920 [Branchiostoma belcheri]